MEERHRNYFLYEICDIYSGVIQQTFKKTGKFKDFEIIELKDMDEYGDINFDSLKKISAPVDIKENYFIRKNDILIKAKSSLKTAGIVGVAIKREILFSSQFYLLRLKNEYEGEIIPSYILWFLNNPLIQDKIKKGSMGSRISFLRSFVLKNLEIPVPSVEIQKNIVELYKSLIKREKLEKELLSLYMMEREYINKELLFKVKGK